MPKHLSVIIPAYNEEKRISQTLSSVFQYLKRQNYSWEVIVVDDGSQDNTAEVVKSFGKGFKIIKNENNSGKGYAVKCGMLASVGDWRLIMDADN